MFGVSASCAVKLVRRWRESGSVAPGKVGGLSQERTIDALWRTVGCLLDRFNPEECRNDFENSGYASN